MALMSKGDGANLTHPRLKAGWIIGATVGIAVIAGIVLVVMWGYGKLAGVTQNVPVVGSITAPARVYMS